MGGRGVFVVFRHWRKYRCCWAVLARKPSVCPGEVFSDVNTKELGAHLSVSTVELFMPRRK